MRCGAKSEIRLNKSQCNACSPNEQSCLNVTFKAKRLEFRRNYGHICKRENEENRDWLIQWGHKPRFLLVRSTRTVHPKRERHAKNPVTSVCQQRKSIGRKLFVTSFFKFAEGAKSLSPTVNGTPFLIFLDIVADHYHRHNLFETKQNKK